MNPRTLHLAFLLAPCLAFAQSQPATLTIDAGAAKVQSSPALYGLMSVRSLTGPRTKALGYCSSDGARACYELNSNSLASMSIGKAM